MSKQCPTCDTTIAPDSRQWKNKIYCSTTCRKVAHRKAKSQNTRAQQRRANMLQNEEVLYLVGQCKRAKTVQILTGHTLESFKETMALIRNRPKVKINLCHIAPVKGKNSIGLLHCRNLFYGGAYQNQKIGRQYISGGLFIKHKHIKDEWYVDSSTPTNKVLLKVEAFLGDIIPRYLETTPVRKSKKVQIIEKITALDNSADFERMINLSYLELDNQLNTLRKRPLREYDSRKESKFLTYLNEITRFISYGDERASMLRKLRKMLVIAYMALERLPESKTYNKEFYIHYERFIQPKYAFPALKNPANWSTFKDFIYNLAFLTLQGMSPDIKEYRKKMVALLDFSTGPHKRIKR